MAEPTPTPSNRNWIIAIAAGLTAVAAGIAAAVMLTGGDPTAAPSTTSTLLVTTTTSLPPTTTTTAPPTTTTTAPVEPGEVAEFVALEDTTLDSESPGRSLGNIPVLAMDQEGDDIERSLVRFQVEGIPGGETVASATLVLYQVNDSDEGGAVSLVDGDWSEADTTWENAPEVGEQVGILPGHADDGPVEIDVTPAVTGNGTVDFYLTTAFDDSLEYSSREGEQAPVLIVAWGSAGAAGETLLVGAGDIASCESEGDETTAGLIEELAEDAEEVVVYTVGDNAYESGSLSDFNDCYDPSWGRFKDVTRPAAGAREYRTPDAAGYFAYFGAAAAEPGVGYYSYDTAGWHIVVLNSNCEDVGGCEAGSPQEQWLRDDLAAASSSCIMAYWHHPLFTSSGSGNPEVRDLYQALFEVGSEVVVNADDHLYERFEPQDPTGAASENGIRQFIVGTGGRSLESAGSPSANSAALFDGGFGVLAFTLTPAGYEWSFVAEPGVDFTDTGSGTCP